MLRFHWWGGGGPCQFDLRRMVSIRNRLEFKRCESILRHKTILFAQSLNNRPVLTSLIPVIKDLGFAAHFSKRAVLRKIISTTPYSSINPSLHGQICVLFSSSRSVSRIRHLIKALSGSQFNHLILGGICFKRTWSLAGIQTMLQMHEKFVNNSVSNVLSFCQSRLTNSLSSAPRSIISLISSLHNKDENK